MTNKRTLIIIAFILIFRCISGFGQIIEDDKKRKTSRLSDSELSKIFSKITPEDFDKLANYHDLINLLNKKDIATWYFGQRNLQKTNLPDLEGSPQSKIINALKFMFFNVCTIHDVLCIIEPGVFFIVKNKEQLMLARVRICKSEKTYKWAIKQLKETTLEKNIQAEYAKFIGQLARQASSRDLMKLFYTHKEHQVVKMRKVFKDISPLLYPEPNFQKILRKVSKYKKLKSDFKLLREISELDTSEDSLANALKSGDEIKVEAAKLISKFNKLQTGNYRIYLKGKLWWTVFLKHTGTLEELKSTIEKNKPEKLDEDILGGPISTWLFVKTGLNSPNTSLAKYFFGYLKYFDFTSGTGDIVAQAIESNIGQTNNLLPYIVKLKINEASSILLKKAIAGDVKALPALLELDIHPKLLNEIHENFKQNRGNKNWREFFIRISKKHFYHEAIISLLEIIEIGSRQEKIAVYSALSKLASMKTVKKLIIGLTNIDAEVKKAAADSLRDLFPDYFDDYGADFNKWEKFWTGLKAVPDYEEIK